MYLKAMKKNRKMSTCKPVGLGNAKSLRPRPFMVKFSRNTWWRGTYLNGVVGGWSPGCETPSPFDGKTSHVTTLCFFVVRDDRKQY